MARMARASMKHGEGDSLKNEPQVSGNLVKIFHFLVVVSCNRHLRVL